MEVPVKTWPSCMRPMPKSTYRELWLSSFLSLYHLKAKTLFTASNQDDNDRVCIPLLSGVGRPKRSLATTLRDVDSSVLLPRHIPTRQIPGSTLPSVGAMGLGLMGFTFAVTQTPDEQAFAVMREAIDRGCTMFNSEFHLVFLLEPVQCEKPTNSLIPFRWRILRSTRPDSQSPTSLSLL